MKPYLIILILILALTPFQKLFAQSEAEVESEMTYGDSDAALADEKLVQDRLNQDLDSEQKAKENAKAQAAANKKRTAQIRAHIDQLKIADKQSQKRRQQTLDEIAADNREVQKLEKQEALVDSELKAKESELEISKKKQEQIKLQIAKTQEQIKKLKNSIEELNLKQATAQDAITKTQKELKQANLDIVEKQKLKNSEVKRLDVATQSLLSEQANTEKKIKDSNLQIKKFENEIAIAERKNKSAQDNLTRAQNLQKENLSELEKLKKAKNSAPTPKNN